MTVYKPGLVYTQNNLLRNRSQGFYSRKYGYIGARDSAKAGLVLGVTRSAWQPDMHGISNTREPKARLETTATSTLEVIFDMKRITKHRGLQAVMVQIFAEQAWPRALNSRAS